VTEREDLRDNIVPDKTVVEYALLCDQVLFEVNGLPSFIRVINRIFPQEPSDLSMSKTLNLAISLIEGEAEEPAHTIRADLFFPDGQKQKGVPQEFMFPHPLVHMFHVFEVDFGTNQHGLHVFEILVNGRRSKRVFLQSILPVNLSVEERLALFGHDPLE
jgi:hypothetical protein